MNLAEAQTKADRILVWLQPFCERLEIVGSIRRGRPECSDVDLVCVPKFKSATHKLDLLTTAQVHENQLLAFLRSYVQNNSPARWLGKRGEPGPEPQDDAVNLLLVTRAGIQLDIFCANDSNFASLKLCRTGSKEHNVWLCNRAIQLGGRWHTNRGIYLRGDYIHAFTEQDIYTALDLPYIRPQDREIQFLSTISL
jgi:DNA polymerase/3'-5' exonuclease PolX